MLQFPPWKVILILVVTLFGAWLALPNALTEKQREGVPLMGSPVNLGLDLQGGVYLLLEVDHQRSVLKQLNDLRRDAQQDLNSGRGDDRIYYSEMRVNPAAVRITSPSADDTSKIVDLVTPITLNADGESDGTRIFRRGQTTVDLVFTDSKMTAIKRDSDISVSTQLDGLLAGVNAVLSRAAFDGNVAFDSVEITQPTFSFKPRDAGRIDDAIALMKKLQAPLAAGFGQSGLKVERGDSDDVVVSFTDQKVEEIRRDAVSQTVSKLGPRLDPDGLGELTVQPQGEDRIIIEAPGEKNPQRLKELIQQPGELTLNLVDDTPGRLQQAVQTGRTRDGYLLVAYDDGRYELVEEDPIITGDLVKSATPSKDEQNRDAVTFTFNQRGGAIFGRESARNVGNRFAIILDGEVKSAPRILTAITGGTGQITGDFTFQEATDLATIIQAGALPADVIVVEERQVGATLGQDSIEAGATASIIGLMLVAVFMIIAYGLFGGFAVGSLVANIVLILGALSGLGATLTLPGIAGIILTIGMAVDANVLVFERIREEHRNGRSPLSAVDVGYQQAMSTIFDANITTLLAAGVLYTLGSGPVKGFAVTLAIGIFTSVFTAFVVTRWFTVIWLRGVRPKSLPI